MGVTEVAARIELEAFDALPPGVRAVLREADHLWASISVRMLWLVQEAAGQSAVQFADWLRLQIAEKR